jgi:hypothetical protein
MTDPKICYEIYHAKAISNKTTCELIVDGTGLPLSDLVEAEALPPP